MMRAIRLLPLLLALASPAWAHAFLLRASPPVGSEVPTSPARLTLRFTEGVEIAFSTVALRNASGATVSIPAPALSPDDPTTIVIPLPKLPPGTYTVEWHVTSVDTHKTEGTFQFAVGS